MTMNRINNENGIGLLEAILIVVIVAAIGLTGWLVYNKNDKSNGTIKSSTTTVSTPTLSPKAQLIAVAKKVYYVDSGYKIGPYLNVCNTSTNCPFTTTLSREINNFKGPSGFGPELMGGAQDAIEGNILYSATPNATGGNVIITISPTKAQMATGATTGPTWDLTIVKENGKELVNNITISMPAAGKITAGCGPVEIYNDQSC